MNTILTYLPFIISTAIGYNIFLFFGRALKLSPFFITAFASGIGLAFSSLIVFISLIFFNAFHAPFAITANSFFLILFTILNIKKHRSIKSVEKNMPPFNAEFKHDGIITIILILLSIPFWYQGHFYLHGGWDAWSTWNLKAKFIFLGGESWSNLFDPILWRASPHYPLLLPFINVWGWSMVGEPLLEVPTFTSYFLTLNTLLLLAFSLKKITGSWWGILPSVFLMTQPYFVKLAYSQYCDILVGYFMLGGIISLVAAQKYNHKAYYILSGIHLALLGFTKSEGLMAALIIGGWMTVLFLFRWKEQSVIGSSHVGPSARRRSSHMEAPYDETQHLNMRSNFIVFYLSAFLTFIPALIFYLFYAPGNQTFINGFTSSTDPLTWIRVKIVLGFYFFEFFGPIWNTIGFIIDRNEWHYVELKWHGVWTIVMAGLLLSVKRAFDYRWIVIPLFLFSYGLIITVYYLMNTYFTIDWWLTVTLHRILFALMPIIFLWVFVSLWREKV